jgi:hypothetical protein
MELTVILLPRKGEGGRHNLLQNKGNDDLGTQNFAEPCMVRSNVLEHTGNR